MAGQPARRMGEREGGQEKERTRKSKGGRERSRVLPKKGVSVQSRPSGWARCHLCCTAIVKRPTVRCVMSSLSDFFKRYLIMDSQRENVLTIVFGFWRNIFKFAVEVAVTI